METLATEGVVKGMEAITGQFSTITGMISTVFDCVTGNALLATFAACSLLGIGIGFFKRFKHV